MAGIEEARACSAAERDPRRQPHPTRACPRNLSCEGKAMRGQGGMNCVGRDAEGAVPCKGGSETAASRNPPPARLRGPPCQREAAVFQRRKR